MDMQREDLLKRFKLMREHIARPTVETMDMGIEYIVASSEGANTVLGQYGTWPAFGPFIVNEEELLRIRELLTVKKSIKSIFSEMQIDYLWQRVIEMLEYCDFDDCEKQKYTSEFLNSLLKICTNPKFEVYVYFDQFNSDLPLFFGSRQELIDEFFSREDLIPWDNMEIDELESWAEIIDESNEFTLDVPD